MADVAGPSVSVEENLNIPDINELDDEPEAKKQKTEHSSIKGKCKLEDRLCGILCCAVCLDLPTMSVYQCSNGHLMCASCLAHLLADARLKDETATCPNCRCEINKSVCIRNLAVEKAISELPSECRYCSQQLARCQLDYHERELCQERQVFCEYEKIGCPWRGPYHEREEHQAVCLHPSKSAVEVLESLKQKEDVKEKTILLYKDIFNLLSFEKITFSDLQLRPYRTDDFITKLFYETSRFSAFNCQWVVKAQINDNQKSPNLTMNRSLSYQLVLKTKVQNPLSLQYIALRGPYGDMKLAPSIYPCDFSNEAQESPFQMLPMCDYVECNKQLSAKTINMRLILFQTQK